jgi:hypothetical protein
MKTSARLQFYLEGPTAVADPGNVLSGPTMPIGRNALQGDPSAGDWATLIVYDPAFNCRRFFQHQIR